MSFALVAGAHADSLEWSADGVTPGGGGTGTWNTSTARWFNGITFQTWSNAALDDAVFGGTAGTVNLGTAITAHGLIFDVTGYSVTGNTLTLGGVTPTISIVPGGSATIDSTIAGTAGLTGTGGGTLILTRNNNYTGGTTISAGTLQLGDGGIRGSILGDVQNDGVLAIDRSNTLIYAGAISGTGALSKSGAGILTLTGDSTYTGGTTINAGTLRLGNNGSTGSIQGDIVDNATLDFNRSDDLIFAGDISGTGVLTKSRANTLTLTGDNSYTGGTTIGAGTLQLGNGGTIGSITGNVANSGALIFNRSDDLIFAGVISGNGSLTKTAANTLTLTGDNTYTGVTTIDAGTLQIGNGGTTGSVARNIANAGAVVFNRSDALIYDRVVSGGGTLSQVGSGTTMLTGNNTYTGATTISAGTLQIGNGGNSGSVAGDIVDNSRLVFDRNNNLTYGGVISGTGNLTKNGARILTLTGDNTFTGGTTISSGTLQLGNNGTSGSIAGDVLDHGVLAINRSDDLIFAGNITGTGALTKSRSSTLTLTGNNSYSGTTTINNNGSVLQAGAENTFSSASAHTLANNTFLDLFGFDQSIGSLAGNGRVTNTDVAAAILTTGDATDTLFSGIIQDGAGSTGLTKSGTGTFTLSGNNTYTGGTTITAGTLQIGNGGNSGIVTGDIIDNGVLAFSRNNNLTFGDIVSGTGALIKMGTNTLTLTSDNTYTGATTISAGTLQIGNGGTSGSLAGDVTNNGVLAINRSDALTLGGVISGTGTLTKSGAGTLILTGESTYGGGTTINAGTLQIGNGGTTGSISGNMVDNGVFVFDRSDALTYAGNISGTGSLVKNGAGTLALTGLNPYSGGTTINAGRLLLADAVLPAPVVALPAAFLGGNGTIGPSMIAGTLAPGLSIGTITVAGDLTFAAPAVYLVEISPTAADRTNVTGAAALGGTVQVQAEAATYTLGTSFTILNAVGGVTGTFAGLTSDFDSAFLAPELGYDANNVFLTIARNGVSFASVGETPNEIATGGAVEALGSGNIIFDTVVSGTAERARRAFDALSGEVHASLSGVLVNQSLFVREAMLGRLIRASFTHDAAQTVALAAGAPTPVAAIENSGRMALGAGTADHAIPDYGHGLTFWTRGFGSWGQFDGNGNAATADRDLGGFISGMDASVGDGWRAGLATGYIRSDINVQARASSADVDSYLLAGYAGGRIGPVALRSGAGWTWHSIESSRAVSFPGFYESETASYGGDTAQIFTELAYPILSDRSSTLEPFAGLAYVHVATDEFTESGPTAALTTPGSDQNVGYSTLGVRAATTMPVAGMRVTPRVSVAWQYAFGELTPELALAFASSGIPFGISGVPLAHNSALIEAGLDLALGVDAKLGVSYSGQLAGELQDNGVQGRLTWRY